MSTPRQHGQELAPGAAELPPRPVAMPPTPPVSSGLGGPQLEIHREHSIMLNTISFKIAEALGQVGEDDTHYAGNPLQLSGEIIQQLQRLRVEACAKADELTAAKAQLERERATANAGYQLIAAAHFDWLTRLREAVHIADELEPDVSDWQRGYRACALKIAAAVLDRQLVDPEIKARLIAKAVEDHQRRNSA